MMYTNTKIDVHNASRAVFIQDLVGKISNLHCKESRVTVILISLKNLKIRLNQEISGYFVNNGNMTISLPTWGVF